MFGYKIEIRKLGGKSIWTSPVDRPHEPGESIVLGDLLSIICNITTKQK